MTESLIDILVISPRIEQLNLEVHEILQISGHEDQLMLDGYRCDLSIGCGRGGATRSPFPVYHHTSVPRCAGTAGYTPMTGSVSSTARRSIMETTGSGSATVSGRGSRTAIADDVVD